MTPDTVVTFSYTSGTTGNPKAAMLTNRNFVSNWCSVLTCNLPAFDEQLIHLCFLPLPHLYERSLQFGAIYNGFFICYFGGNVLKLVDDI